MFKLNKYIIMGKECQTTKGMMPESYQFFMVFFGLGVAFNFFYEAKTEKVDERV